MCTIVLIERKGWAVVAWKLVWACPEWWPERVNSISKMQLSTIDIGVASCYGQAEEDANKIFKYFICVKSTWETINKETLENKVFESFGRLLTSCRDN